LLLQLPLKASEKDIYEFFAKGNVGKIRDIRIIKDPRTNRSKGIAYVEFYYQESVFKVCFGLILSQLTYKEVRSLEPTLKSSLHKLKKIVQL
jgi:RNA recognition motif-containing protein